jgi:dTDP-4-dehydrorhamnose 3,5-epimerase
MKDQATVTRDGVSLAAVPHGVTFRDITTHVDDRGSVFELFDPRWGWDDDPLVYAYVATIRPGKIKGWAMHELHDDRYAILYGAIEVVLYDEREDSPTQGLVSTVVLTEHHRRLIRIPTGIWHADRNIGDREAAIVNFPTVPYDHGSPDKYRLPLDTDRIPHRWPDEAGW